MVDSGLMCDLWTEPLAQTPRSPILHLLTDVSPNKKYFVILVSF